MNPIEITYAGIRLNDVSGGIVIDDIDVWNTPSRQIVSSQLALADGAINTFSKLNARVITITGWINQASKQEFERMLDSIKRAMYGREQLLDVVFEDGRRTWVATLTDSVFDRGYLPDHTDFTLRFWCGNPIATGETETIAETSYTTTSTNSTAINTFYGNTFQGTSTAPVKPIIRFNIIQWVQSVAFNVAYTYLDIANPDGVGVLRMNFSPNLQNWVGVSPTHRGIFELDFDRRIATLDGNEIVLTGVWTEWLPNLPAFRLSLTCNSEAVFTARVSGEFNHRYI